MSGGSNAWEEDAHRHVRPKRRDVELKASRLERKAFFLKPRHLHSRLDSFSLFQSLAKGVVDRGVARCVYEPVRA